MDNEWKVTPCNRVPRAAFKKKGATNVIMKRIRPVVIFVLFRSFRAWGSLSMRMSEYPSDWTWWSEKIDESDAWCCPAGVRGGRGPWNRCFDHCLGVFKAVY